MHKITIKNYFRQLELHDLGIDADDNVIEIYNYIINNLSDFSILSGQDSTIYINYYKNNNNVIIFEYNGWNNHVVIDYDVITRQLLKYFPNNENSEIDNLLIHYISEIYNISIHELSHF